MRDLIIHSEEEGAPAPWATTTTGDDFSSVGEDVAAVSFASSSLRLRFGGGGEAIPSQTKPPFVSCRNNTFEMILRFNLIETLNLSLNWFSRQSGLGTNWVSWIKLGWVWGFEQTPIRAKIRSMVISVEGF